jgi:predicted peroxiredoxin
MKLNLQFSAALAVSALAACATPTGETIVQTSIETDAMLTIVTSGDPETQLMALVLTRSAKAAGEAPRILLCSAGGNLALAEAPESTMMPLQPQGASPQGVLKALIKEGVQVDVCAIYLPNRTFGKEALIEGIGVAKPDDIGKLIASPDIQILSF